MESKKGVRTWIQFICIAIIFIVGSYLLLANLFHMYAISEKEKTDVFYVSQSTKSTFRKLQNDLYEKNQQLKTMDHTNTFTTQELLSLKNYLKAVEDRMSNSQCLDELNSVNDVHIYKYLHCVKNMLPNSELMESISSSLENKKIDGMDLEEMYQEKIKEYDNYAGYELSQLQENYHYYRATNKRNDFINTITFSQQYIIHVLEDHIHFINFLLEDGGVM